MTSKRTLSLLSALFLLSSALALAEQPKTPSHDFAASLDLRSRSIRIVENVTACRGLDEVEYFRDSQDDEVMFVFPYDKLENGFRYAKDKLTVLKPRKCVIGCSDDGWSLDISGAGAMSIHRPEEYANIDCGDEPQRCVDAINQSIAWLQEFLPERRERLDRARKAVDCAQNILTAAREFIEQTRLPSRR